MDQNNFFRIYSELVDELDIQKAIINGCTAIRKKKILRKSHNVTLI